MSASRRRRRPPAPPLSGRAIGGGVEEEDPARFLESVSRALDYTAAGDVYQTNSFRGSGR